MSKRADAIGFFWQDLPTVKPPKAEKPKCVPPEPVWERPDYLPGLQEALEFPVVQLEDYELVIAAAKGERFVFDIECYLNYFLVAFKSLVSGKVIYFERTETKDFDTDKLNWLVHSLCLVGFNSNSYDLPILALALAGKSCLQLKHATNEIITNGTQGHNVLRSYKVKPLKINHIDLIEVAPLFASLKIYGGRLHAPKMQDLPFHHASTLSQPQMAIIRWYCVNDLETTEWLHNSLTDQLSLREVMSKQYGTDLRSKSDAQIAEAVIAEEVRKINGRRPQRPDIPIGTRYRYKVPGFMRFHTPLMNWVLGVVANTDFIVGDAGNIGLPEALANMDIRIADGVYRLRIGGLHSSESKSAHVADDNYFLRDEDVESYYPRIILNQKLYPSHLGPAFLQVYQKLVDQRINAKHTGDKVAADSLKITINGSFGKLGSAFSILYAPDLLIQVTITGQLCLLMLIERLELCGFSVVSANTDGIVIRGLRDREAELDDIIAQWRKETNYITEQTRYRAVYSKDVNNYIAVYEKPKTNKDGSITYAKTKGAYAATGLSKNPTNAVCVDAVIALLTKGTPIQETIRQCCDVRKFVTVRAVTGGGVKAGEYLGKSIRWYYRAGETGEIVYAKSGKKVPRTDGAAPILQLPSALPSDIDFDWYEKEALRMLSDIGYA